MFLQFLIKSGFALATAAALRLSVDAASDGMAADLHESGVGTGDPGDLTSHIEM
jgi:hypothetical protein